MVVATAKWAPSRAGFLERGPLEPLLNASYRQLWCAKLLSSAGSQASRMAVILLLVQRGGHAAAIGALLWCDVIPGMALSFVSGGLADKAGMRVVMAAADLFRMLSLVAAALRPEPALLYAVAAINAGAAAFFNPARSAAVPLVMRSDALVKANAMDQAASTLVMIVGPVAGAQIFALWGVRWALTADAASFLVSALLIWASSIPKANRASGAAKSLGAEIRDGWQYIRRHTVAQRLVSLIAVSVLAVGLWIPVVGGFIRSYLRAPQSAMALQLTIFGFGGLCGAPLAAWLSRRLGRGRLFGTMLLGESICMMVYSHTSALAASNVLIFFWGVVVTSIMVPFSSLLQETVAKTHLGRVFAISDQTESVASILSVLVAMLLERVLPPQDIFLCAGIVYALIVAAAFRTATGRNLLLIR